MGLLVLHQDKGNCEYRRLLFQWLKRECKATIVRLPPKAEDTWHTRERYEVQGEGIPDQMRQFDVECTFLTSQVVMFSIV
jgi:hypothetical protein